MRVKEFVIFNFGVIGEVRNLIFGVDCVLIVVFIFVGFLLIVVFYGIVVVIFIEFVLFGIKNMEFGERKSFEG